MEITEGALLACVLELARFRGFHAAHFRPGLNRRGSWSTPVQGDPGFPDLVLARLGRVLFVELKGNRGRLSAGQREWMGALEGAEGSGVEVYLWTPEEWRNGTIARILGAVG